MYQCNRCLAPLRVHQGRPVRVCDRCGAIQTDAGPPPGSPPPGPGAFSPGPGAFSPGPGAFSPARRKSPALMIVLAAVVLALLVAGFAGAVLMRRKTIASSGPGSALTGGVFTGPPGGATNRGGAPVWDDAQAVKDRVLRELGPGASVTEVLLYREYAFVEVQGDGERIRYELRDGVFKRSNTGVTIPAIPGRRPVDARIKLADVDFQRVPAIVKEAQARVGGRPDDHVHVRLARQLPFIADPLWTVHIGHGNAEFDLEGKLVGGRTAQGAELDKQVANYFADASPVRAGLVRRFGPDVQLVDLTLYSTYAIMEVRDPAQPDNVDRYTLRPAGMSPGDPMQNTRGGWDAKAFRLSSIDFALVPRLAADAKGRLRGDVTHIIVEKGKIRVYVRDERNSGYVSYHLDGRLDRVMD